MKTETSAEQQPVEAAHAARRMVSLPCWVLDCRGFPLGVLAATFFTFGTWLRRSMIDMVFVHST